ncbi:MAG: HD domain-containing protein [Capnocytophaga sp.]|nr:HD domain-containing protein [Capnocytophaga sp.]
MIHKTAEHIKELYADRLPAVLVYHNLRHTQRVVRKVQELAFGEECNHDDTKALVVAAWFHDAGYVKQYTENEHIGAEMAVAYLTQEGADTAFTETVKNLILVTRPDAVPVTHLEKIMKDADCSHVASSYYFEVAGLLRKELELHKGEKINPLEWEKENLGFFQKHHFYTDTAQRLWNGQKAENEKKLTLRIAKKEEKLTMQEKNDIKKNGTGGRNHVPCNTQKPYRTQFHSRYQSQHFAFGQLDYHIGNACHAVAEARLAVQFLYGTAYVGAYRFQRDYHRAFGA